MSQLDENLRYCIRCGVPEWAIKKDGSSGCFHYANKIAKYHSYTTDKEQKKWEKENLTHKEE